MPKTKKNPVGAIVLAAGQSKRFRSSRSKLVHQLGGVPMIRWPLQALREIGVDPIVVVVGPQATELREACGPDVVFVVQSEPLGTGHAVLSAQGKWKGFDGPVVVMNGDLPALRAPTLRRLIAAQRKTPNSLALLTALVLDSSGWGRIVRRNGAVRAIVEERDATRAERALREVNVGVYCVPAKFLFRTLRRLKPDNAQHEIYLTDVVAHAVASKAGVRAVAAPEGEVGQVNHRVELAAMERTFRGRINIAWMEAGVTLQDPETTYIASGVTIGADTVIGANVHLNGRTRIGRRCRIDGSAFLTDATIGDDVHLRFGVVMTDAVVGDGCQIGPFANLRPATLLREGVHIGDFVETKNAILGRGTKANHLAYLGDTEIGRETNIGAGTITCNYDGFRKHRTVIGDRVQVGSDTQLVAPVSLGDDVYVASGSTVRRDVPPGALVFNPRQQSQRAGWVAARRSREAAASGGTSRSSAAAKAKKPASGTATNPSTRARSARAKRTKS